jgi:hypothetical protein
MIVAMVLKNKNDTPDRQTQRLGDLIAKTAGGDKENIMFVFADGYTGSTLYDLIAGFGPTATFAPDQIRTLSGRHLPDPERFVRLIELIRANEAREKPRQVAAVIADAEFIMAFLRFYFITVAQDLLAADLCDLIRPDSIAINIATHRVRIFQSGGPP